LSEGYSAMSSPVLNDSGVQNLLFSGYHSQFLQGAVTPISDFGVQQWYFWGSGADPECDSRGLEDKTRSEAWGCDFHAGRPLLPGGLAKRWGEYTTHGAQHPKCIKIILEMLKFPAYNSTGVWNS
jgi:hypothetical protein